MSSTGSRTVLIAGGGITGLTAALCLARRGFRVDLFERAEGFETVGAGLQISPNAFHVLSAIGVSQRLKEVATGPLYIRAMSARTGQEIAAIPLGATAIERYGAPYLLAHRADLHQVLAGAVHDHPDIELYLNARLEDFSVHPNGVTSLVFRSGRLQEHPGAALIAADGVWSTLRTRCFGAKPAMFSGLIAWRCLINTEQLPGSRDLENLQLWLAPNAHAVSYPVRGGRYLNLVVVTGAAERGKELQRSKSWASAVFASELKKELDGWCREFRSLLDYRTRWTQWPLYHSPRTPSWISGPAALAGDAAHAMLPFAAQGAAMGMEDASVLADCLASGRSRGDLAEGLVRYQEIRKSRVSRAARLALANHKIYHLVQPFGIVRDISMSLIGGRRLLSRQDWLYGWRPDHDESVAHSIGSATASPE